MHHKIENAYDFFGKRPDFNKQKDVPLDYFKLNT